MRPNFLTRQVFTACDDDRSAAVGPRPNIGVGARRIRGFLPEKELFPSVLPSGLCVNPVFSYKCSTVLSKTYITKKLQKRTITVRNLTFTDSGSNRALFGVSLQALP